MNKENITKKQLLIGFILIFIIANMIFIVSHSSFDNLNPPKYTAQDSMHLINNCYETNVNALECYHLCREEGWIEDYCIEVDRAKIMGYRPIIKNGDLYVKYN